MLLFPADSLERDQVERDYRAEWDAAQSAGFETAIFNFDGLRRYNALDAVLRRVPPTDEPQLALYRGWMLSPSFYANLVTGMKKRGWKMLQDSSRYRIGHHAPDNFAFWRGAMPETRWIERLQFERDGAIDFAPVLETLRPFGSSPVIVKDWVKSCKHRWSDACFIRDASDEGEVRRIVSNFLELRGDDLEGGLVFRRFERLRPGEWRSFWLNGKLLSLSPNPSGDEAPDVKPFVARAKRCPSRFFSLDFAQKESGEWMIIEMGDGGVSGLAPGEDVEAWYAMLRSGLQF